MDFVSGALPNVMFLVGIVAIGIGLGIEFKIVEVKGDLSKSGRIGAFGVGAALIAISVLLYMRPAATASGNVVAPTASLTSAQAPGAASESQAQVAPPTSEPLAVATDAPSATPEPSPMPTNTPWPTNTPAPTSTPEPTIVTVEIPSLRDLGPRDAEKLLKAQGLQLGEKKERCEQIGAGETPRGKKGQIVCQAPAAGSSATPGAQVDYVVEGDK